MNTVATDRAYYHAVADAYDDMKADDNYKQFADLLMPLLRRWSVPGQRLLDVGCGTGASSIMFAERGFDVVGCDESTQMLEIARQKYSDRGITFLRADMRELPEELAGFDVVAWIDDVANHLLTDDDLRAAFTQARRALADDGLFVFDVNTISGFRAHLCADTIVERDDAVLLLRGQPGEFPPGGLARVRLVAFHRSMSDWKRREGEIVERHFSPSKIVALLNQAGFEHLGAYGLGGGLLVERADEDMHIKTLHIARRAALGRDREAMDSPWSA